MTIKSRAGARDGRIAPGHGGVSASAPRRSSTTCSPRSNQTLADTEIGSAFGITTLPHVRNLSIIGPHRVTGVSDTASRRQVFTCRPTLGGRRDGVRDGDHPPARRAGVSAAGDRPRRDASADVLPRGREERDFEAGIAKALEAILASPQFLFRVEEAPANAARRSLSAGRLRTRQPSVVLLVGQRARRRASAPRRRGTLATTAALTEQARRMMADPRIEALATRFASQWLRLQDVERVKSGRDASSRYAIRPRAPCAARPRCFSTAWCAKTAASSSSSRRTTRSPMSGWRVITGLQT